MLLSTSAEQHLKGQQDDVLHSIVNVEVSNVSHLKDEVFFFACGNDTHMASSS